MVVQPTELGVCVARHDYTRDHVRDDQQRLCAQRVRLHRDQNGGRPEDVRALETLWDVLRRPCPSAGTARVPRVHQLQRMPARAATSSSNQDYVEQVLQLVHGLRQGPRECGFTPYACNMIGFNSPEWIIADLGCMMAQGLAAGICDKQP